MPGLQIGLRTAAPPARVCGARAPARTAARAMVHCSECDPPLLPVPVRTGPAS